jgi:hypothetical protein
MKNEAQFEDLLSIKPEGYDDILRKIPMIPNPE